MAVKTLTLKESKLPLPKTWRGAEILVREERDTLVVKRILRPEEPIFDEKIVKNLKMLGRRVSEKMLRDAVRWARD